MSRTRLPLVTLVFATALLAGCDMVAGALGIPLTEKIAAAREADGRAVGGACRHAGRAIEDCYALNRKAAKASVFAGWRDMNDYMRENKIDPVVPQIATPAGTGTGAADAAVAESALAAPSAAASRPRQAPRADARSARTPNA